MKFQYREGWVQWGHRATVWVMGTGTLETEHCHTADRLPTAIWEEPGLSLWHAEDITGHYPTEIAIALIYMESV